MKIVFLGSLQLWTTRTLFNWRLLKEHVKYPEKLSLPRMNARVSLHWPLSLLECVCVCVCARAHAHMRACVHCDRRNMENWLSYFLVGEAHLSFWSQWQMGWSWGVYCTIFQLFFFLKKIFIYWSIVALCISFCLQQSESVIHISPLLGISFSFRSPQSVE